MTLEILPLAVTMMLGPQIMSAVIFVTSERPVQVSLAFVVGVIAATAAGVAITFGLATLLGDAVELGDSSKSGSAGNIVQFALIALLILAALKNYVGRETIEPPKWLGSLMRADAAKALKVGLLVILVMPSDILVMLTVGVNLAQEGASYTAALPFIGLTGLIAALPLVFFLVLHRRAVQAMPKVRDWMNANSWLVNVIVCVAFIVLLASG